MEVAEASGSSGWIVAASLLCLRYVDLETCRAVPLQNLRHEQTRRFSVSRGFFEVVGSFGIEEYTVDVHRHSRVRQRYCNLKSKCSKSIELDREA